MAEITPCEWREYWECDYEVWETACDRKFEFMNDGPAENDYQFCPGCGRPIETPVLDKREQK